VVLQGEMEGGDVRRRRCVFWWSKALLVRRLLRRRSFPVLLVALWCRLVLGLWRLSSLYASGRMVNKGSTLLP
jgi:hypothetical protein